MKKILILSTTLLFITSYAIAQQQYSAKEATKHLNQYITVCDTVVRVEIINNKLHIYYIGNAEHSVAVLKKSSGKRFHNNDSFLNGLEICLSGVLHRKNKKYIISANKKIIITGPFDL